MRLPVPRFLLVKRTLVLILFSQHCFDKSAPGLQLLPLEELCVPFDVWKRELALLGHRKNRGEAPEPGADLPNARGEERSDGRVRTMLLLVPSLLAIRVGSLSLRSRLTRNKLSIIIRAVSI